MNYYYTFIKADQFIAVSATGESPDNVDIVEWTSSPGMINKL